MFVQSDKISPFFTVYHIKMILNQYSHMKKYEHNTISVFPSQKAGGYNKGSKTAGTKKPGRLLKERENLWKRKQAL